MKLGNSPKIKIFALPSQPKSMSRRILIAVTNDLSGDQRIHRIAGTLHDAGHDVRVVGRVLPRSLPLAPRPYRTHRMRLMFRRGKLFYLEYNFRLFFFLLFAKADVINANDLDTLLGGYWAARLTGAELIYDSHEYFTEVPELIHRPGARSVWLLLEKWLFPRIQKAYTVNASIAAIYREKYGMDVQVVRNLPLRKDFPEPPGSGEKILLYQGALNLGRGLELLIDSMAHLPDFRLWIAGRGDVDAQLRAQVKQKNLIERVSFLGFVPLEDLHRITAEASLGLSIEEDLGANYHFASPNKVCDYIQAGVPVLVSDLPEMRALVTAYEVGHVLDSRDRNPEALAARIRELFQSGALARWRENCRQAAAELTWEREQEKLLQIYSGSHSRRDI